MDAEREQLEAKRREKDEQHLFLTAKVSVSPRAILWLTRQIITDDIYCKHQGFDLASFDDKNLPATELPTFRVLKTESYALFKQRIAAWFKIPEREFRLWVLVNRQNKTIRPDLPIADSDAQQSKSEKVNRGRN